MSENSTSTVDQLRQLSGILSYAAMACRPDLAVAASLLSSTKWNDVTADDINAGKRAIQYIAHTLQRVPKLGLRYNAQVFSTILAATTLMCFADSDYAGDMTTCRSRSGHVIMLCNAAIYWSSKLQDTIARSSTAAELTSISDLCRRLVWIAELMRHLTFPQRLVAMYEDNKPAIAVAYTARTSRIVFATCESATFGFASCAAPTCVGFSTVPPLTTSAISSPRFSPVGLSSLPLLPSLDATMCSSWPLLKGTWTTMTCS